MISHKVLIILTVIFGSIICLKGIFTESEEYKDYKDSKEYKDYKDSKECKECEDILNKIGFKSDSGFHNIIFLLQFTVKSNLSKNNVEFADYVKKRMNISSYDNGTLPNEIDNAKSDIPDDATTMNIEINDFMASHKQISHSNLDTSDDSTSTINHKTIIESEIASYLNSFYKDIISNDCSILKELAVTPIQYCTSSIEKKKELQTRATASQGIISRFIGFFTTNLGRSVAKNSTDEKPPSEEEEQRDIQECKKSIVEYELKKGDKTYKYDGNNGYKCLLTSIDIALTYDPDEDMDIVQDMEEGMREYYTYHLDLAIEYNESFDIFTAPELCINHLIKQKNETLNLPKDDVIKDDEENR